MERWEKRLQKKLEKQGQGTVTPARVPAGIDARTPARVAARVNPETPAHLAAEVDMKTPAQVAAEINRILNPTPIQLKKTETPQHCSTLAQVSAVKIVRAGPTEADLLAAEERVGLRAVEECARAAETLVRDYSRVALESPGWTISSATGKIYGPKTPEHFFAELRERFAPRALDPLTEVALIALVKSARQNSGSLWNAWRNRDPSWQTIVLSGLYMRKAKLSGSNFSGVVLKRANFRGAVLDQNWQEFSLRFPDDVPLPGLVPVESGLVSSFESATLGDIDFTAAFLHQAQFCNADLQRCKFRSANLRDADFRGADLGGADFSGAYIESTSFAGANLRGAIFRDRMILTGVEFSGAHLDGADFSTAQVDVSSRFDQAHFRTARNLRIWQNVNQMGFAKPIMEEP